jgi:hypothetical protein
MKLCIIYFAIFLLAVVAGTSCSKTDGGNTASQNSMQPAETHQTHSAEVNERGDKTMGFSHGATTHHFRLTPDGGTIEVEANDAQDTASRDKIRMHLERLSVMFAEGNFDSPLFIHNQTPPGVPVMQRLKAKIRYTFEETERGGRVRIKTSGQETIDAVHEFLRFQIKEHKTGDSLEIGKTS